MQLLQSWKENLILFIPKNLKLFLLVTLKSLVGVYKTFFVYWWWLVLFYLIGDQWFGQLPIPQLISTGMGGRNPMSSSSLLRHFGILHAAICLSVRPSVARKSCHYFFGYAGYFLYVVALLTAYILINGVIISHGISWILIVIWHMIAFGVIAFFILFLFDSDGRPVSSFLALVRAKKMVFYNLPFVVITWLTMRGLHWILYLPINTYLQGYQMVNHLVYLFFLPIPVCVMTNFYVKRLHEQFGLYFEVK